ncbi:MAG: accessory gene regulator B family protein [Oscillospiraceae bacterium]|jgi:accessory gene regulator B|nr:accessory gene regulator B family protein [Oscillospiraceae bacterium]
MINHLANRVAFLFVIYGESSEENADIYSYALEAIIAFITNFIVCIIISLFFNRLAEGIVFMLGFAVIRRVTGGYHAKSHKSCILSFACVVIIAMMILCQETGGVDLRSKYYPTLTTQRFIQWHLG